MEHDRISGLRALFSGLRIDSLLVSQFYDILYLTGFKTLSPHEREAFVFVTKQNTYLFTDGRYADDVKNLKQLKLRLLTSREGLIKHLQEIVQEEKIEGFGFEREDLRWSEYDLMSRHLKTSMLPADRTILGIRAEKNAEELSRIKKACEIGDECLRETVSVIKPGMKEREIAWYMEKWIREQGYELSFDPIVASGKNSAVPHYNTKEGNGTVEENSILLIDMGVRYRDYCSDISRVFFTGTPSPEATHAYSTLKKAQEDAIAHLGKNEELRKTDALCRLAIENGGFPAYPHSTGHGVGLEVHEYPKVSASSMDLRKPRQVFTVEPGIYIPGKWGMRIEDTVCIDEKGKVRVMTSFPKSVQVIG